MAREFEGLRDCDGMGFLMWGEEGRREESLVKKKRQVEERLVHDRAKHQ